MHPRLAGASESLPRLFSIWYGPTVEKCIVPEIFSFFQLLTGASIAPVLLFLTALPPGAVILVSSIQGLQ
jgi:hypothetical protein